MNLTDSHGIEVAGRLNARGKDVDIIAITAVRHLQVIRSAISTGITQYLIKPFTFAAFREKLENQREFRRGLGGSGGLATQASVDNALSARRSVSATRLPKGLIAETLEAVSDEVRESAEPVSATEVGQRLELSRVTVRRYLEHLVATKQAIKQPRHGTPGRPEYEYRWGGGGPVTRPLRGVRTARRRGGAATARTAASPPCAGCPGVGLRIP